MYSHKAIRVQCTSHVVDVGLTGLIDSREVGTAKDIDWPRELILRVLLEESLVSEGGRVVGGKTVNARKSVDWRRFGLSTALLVVFGRYCL